MRSFLIEFQERRIDVRRYLASLVLAERKFSSGKFKSIHEAELRMFRASAILVIYNAIEASARAGIQAIYDEISVTHTSFDDLHSDLRRRVIRDFKLNFSADRADDIDIVALEIVTASFNARRVFNGNVDAKEIRDQAKDYGFKTNSEYKLTKHGSDLLTIKSRRNDLAHGDVSFGEVGREYLARDLYIMGKCALNYVESILNQIDGYLNQSGYKSKPAA